MPQKIILLEKFACIKVKKLKSHKPHAKFTPYFPFTVIEKSILIIQYLGNYVLSSPMNEAVAKYSYDEETKKGNSS